MYFPYTFPALFGQEYADSSLNVTAAATAGVVRNVAAVADLGVAAAAEGAGRYGAAAQAFPGEPQTMYTWTEQIRLKLPDDTKPDGSRGTVYEQISSGTWYAMRISNNIYGIAPGDRFYCEIWAKKSADNVSDTGSLFFGAAVYNSSEAALQYISTASSYFTETTFRIAQANDGTPATAGLGPGALTTDWQKIAGIVQVTHPAAHRMHVYVQINGLAPTLPAGSKIYWTDPKVVKLAPIELVGDGTPSRLIVAGASLSGSALAAGAGATTARAAAILPAVASPSAAGTENAVIAASLTVSASASVTSQEQGVASASTAVSVSASGAISVGKSLSASLGLSAVPSTGGRGDAVASGALSIGASVGAAGVRTLNAEAGFGVFAQTDATVSRGTFCSSVTNITVGQAGRSPYVWSPSGPTVIKPTKTALFTDYFTFPNTENWHFYNSADANGVLTSTTSDSFILSRVKSLNADDTGIYDITDSSISIRLVKKPTTGTVQLLVFPNSNVNPLALARIYVNYIAADNTWQFGHRADNNYLYPETAVNFDSAGPWIRLRVTTAAFSGSDRIYWDSSFDGVTWSNLHSLTFSSTRMGGCQIRLTNGNGAEWDDFNILPNTAESSLAISATPVSDGQRGQVAQAALATNANTSGLPRYDARGQAHLAADAYRIAGMVKTLYSTATLGIQHFSSPAGTEFGIGDTDLTVAVSLLGAMASDRVVTAFLQVIAYATATASHGQFIEADSLDAYFDPTADSAADLRPGSNLAAHASVSAAAVRTANVSSSLSMSATAGPSSAFEFTVAQSTALIFASAAGSVRRDQKLAAPATVQFLIGSSAVLRRIISGTFAATASSWATAEEPFSVTSVPAENRIASVAESDRGASVDEDFRSVAVESVSTNVSII